MVEGRRGRRPARHRRGRFAGPGIRIVRLVLGAMDYGLEVTVDLAAHDMAEVEELVAEVELVEGLWGHVDVEHGLDREAHVVVPQIEQALGDALADVGHGLVSAELDDDGPEEVGLGNELSAVEHLLGHDGGEQDGYVLERVV